MMEAIVVMGLVDFCMAFVILVCCVAVLACFGFLFPSEIDKKIDEIQKHIEENR
jgi:hypothetical protein